MPGFIQRYPHGPKAVWWKRYGDILKAKTETETIEYNHSQYVRQYAFDCCIDGDQQNAETQPIKGLEVDSSYITIKTHNFSEKNDIPKVKDIIQYDSRYWIIDEIQQSFLYAPKRKKTLFISLNSIIK